MQELYSSCLKVIQTNQANCAFLMTISIIHAKTFRTRKNFPESNACALQGFLGLCLSGIPYMIQRQLSLHQRFLFDHYIYSHVLKKHILNLHALNCFFTVAILHLHTTSIKIIGERKMQNVKFLHLPSLCPLQRTHFKLQCAALHLASQSGSPTKSYKSESLLLSFEMIP